MRRLTFLIAAIAAAAATGFAQPPAAEWPQLFGPSRNGAARSAIPASATLSVAWKKPIPAGSAGIAASGERLYTLGSDGERDILMAIDAATGDEAWRLALGNTHADAAVNGPGSTPALAGNLLLTVSSLCQFQAIDVLTRQVVWTVDLGTAYGSRFATRGGCGMSPLVAGPRVVLVTGAARGPRLAAFDVATGKRLWEAADLPNSYNLSPGWMEGGDGRVLYHHTKPPGISGVTAIDAATGATLWQIDGKTGESDATPVAVGAGRVLIETWPQVSLFDVASRTPVWTTPRIAAGRAPAVARNGHLYTFGGQSGEFLTCVDAATGEVTWTSRIYRGHLALAGDTLVVLSESSGLLRLVAADPAGYRELAKVQVLMPGARTGTPPSLAGRRIFVRNLEELVAIAIH